MTAAIDVRRFSRPKYVGRYKTPPDLNAMTLGQMFQLSRVVTPDGAFYAPCEILLGMSHEEVRRAEATQVVRFAGWVSAQLEKVNELWGRLKPQYSAEELRAGVERLSFGAFGIADWYARRMGINDHEIVMQVPWLRVYQCMKIDTETAAYQRRLQQIRINEAKAKQRHR